MTRWSDFVRRVEEEMRLKGIDPDKTENGGGRDRHVSGIDWTDDGTEDNIRLRFDADGSFFIETA